VRKTDARGRTWPQFVAQWLINERHWLLPKRPDARLLGLVLCAQFEGVIDRDMAKAYFQ
jgi:hypothetical protein